MKRSLIQKLFIVISLSISQNANAEARLYHVNAPTAKEYFGYSIVTIADLDGDNTEDFLVSSPRESSVFEDAGTVRIISGSDRHVIRVHNGEKMGQLLGITLATLGDVNHDGLADYAIASQRTPGIPLQFDRGSVSVFSGFDGALLYRKVGTKSRSQFGYALARMDDLNSDGIAELAVGEPNAGANNEGAVYILSGSDGALVRTIAAAPLAESFGSQLTNTADVNNDGRADLLVSAPNAFLVGLPELGGIYLYSGADMSLLAQRVGELAGMKFGATTAALGDINNDGTTELAVTATIQANGVFQEQQVHILSAANLADVHLLSSPEATFGTKMLALGDVDYDNIADFAVSTPSQVNNGSLYAGWVDIYSGLNFAKIADYRHWDAMIIGSFGGALTLADADSDGKPELVTALHAISGGGYMAGYSIELAPAQPLNVQLYTRLSRGGEFNVRIVGSRNMTGCELSLNMAKSKAELSGPVAPIISISATWEFAALRATQNLPRVKGSSKRLYAQVQYSCRNGESGLSNLVTVDLSKNKAKGKKRTSAEILRHIRKYISNLPLA